MVKDWGMSDKVGLRTIEPSRGFNQGDSLGPSTTELVSIFLVLHMSSKTKRDFTSLNLFQQIDAEIKKILSESYERAKSILKSHPKELKSLAEALLKYETLDSEDIKAIMEKKSSDASLN